MTSITRSTGAEPAGPATDNRTCLTLAGGAAGGSTEGDLGVAASDTEVTDSLRVRAGWSLVVTVEISLASAENSITAEFS